MGTAAGGPGRRLLGQLDGALLDELDEVLEVAEVLLDEEDDELSPPEDPLLLEDSLAGDELVEDFFPESRLSVR